MDDSLIGFSEWYRRSHKHEFKKRWQEYRRECARYRPKLSARASMEQQYGKHVLELVRLRRMAALQLGLTPKTHPFYLTLKKSMRHHLNAMRIIREYIEEVANEHAAQRIGGGHHQRDPAKWIG